MRVAPVAQNPQSLSYYALRQAVGWIAVGLPVALALPWYLLHGPPVLPSISDYYYTGMRNLFVGSLCGIGLFNFSCRGYDLQDEIAGTLSGVCAVGVAFCPTLPTQTNPCTPANQTLGVLHWVFAAVLFATLAYMCIELFTMTARNVLLTRQKLERNRLYYTCGVVILASALTIAFLNWRNMSFTILGLGSTFLLETIALWAFGLAWLVKGGTFLRDKPEAV
jgi:hypothetical protein